MRSAETSGVGGKGFGLRAAATARFNVTLRSLVRSLRHLRGRVSPVTLTLCATAFGAAGLYAVTDTAWTLITVRSADAPMARAALAAPAAEPRVTAAGVPAPGVVREESPAIGAAIEGALKRGAGAFGLAFAFGAVLLARRPRVNQPVSSFEALVATLPFGVACWSADGRLLRCNATFRTCLGLPSNAAEADAGYRQSVARLLEGGEMRVLHDGEASRLIELQRNDGSCLVIDERPLAHGGFVTLVNDVTESRRTDGLLNSIREELRLLARRYHEEKLRAEAASRSKTMFLAHLSHDIRTPLNHIIGFADMMRQETYGPLGDPRYRGYVENMHESGARLMQFFESILELSELENGDKPLAAEPFSIDDMLAGVFRRFAPQAHHGGVALLLGSPCGARLTGDRFALERMAGNIVENALRFTPAGGKVTISAYVAADGVVLEITDTGIGISAERLEVLSQPFTFADAALTRQHSGAGLGIAISRAIAELSGGHLAIDSRPALGTTVAISLPLPVASEARAA